MASSPHLQRLQTRFASALAVPFLALLAGIVPACAQSIGAAHAQDAPAIVQPGAPGEPSKTLPASTRPSLPPLAAADVEFMQGMIMHHQQAVEMTALIPSHTENAGVRSLGAKISSSQSDEIRFMQRLARRARPGNFHVDARYARYG